MILYGIASAAVAGTVEDFYLTRAEAEAVLAAVLTDEPDFEAVLWVQAFEFDTSPN
jgi:hypothetical protein